MCSQSHGLLFLKPEQEHFAKTTNLHQVTNIYRRISRLSRVELEGIDTFRITQAVG
jgi:hypothetical protein